MIVYFAGAESFAGITKGRNVLTSYLSFNNNLQKFNDFYKFITPRRLFMDSGAFTAFTQGRQINIDNYINFVLPIQSKLDVIANLDVIGNPQDTDKNWRYMKSKGVNALPVFHFGSDINYLKRYLKEDKVDYIALGGLVPYTKKRKLLQSWLDYCFRELQAYFPIKVHLFGITSQWILERYPAYSCDSTGWISTSKHGRIVKYKNFRIKETDPSVSYYLKQSRNYKLNLYDAVVEYVKMEEDITSLWQKRGFIWK